ncbi:MAG: DegT/DnrJ/EryC1/StrS family aminotransferase [Longimicrobiales bacterium]
MVKFLDLHRQYLSIQAEVDEAIRQTLRDSSFIGGPAVRAFEREFAAYQQVAHCAGVANGTDALEVALEALALPPGSEVIVPANSFIASSEVVTRSGHRVVFADVDPDDYTLDIENVAVRITPRSKAIIAVHLYGHPCDMEALTELSRAHGIRVIEDCAQSHGAEVAGRRVGGIGDIAAFSFYPGKVLGAYGDAGAITTNDPALAERCRMIANHGRSEKYNHAFEGRNSRLDGLQAAILRVKLKRLEQWVEHRNRVADRYLRELQGSCITLPAVRPWARHAFHLFVIRSERRDDLAAFLARAGIETGVHYPVALPDLPAYSYLPRDGAPARASAYAGQVLSLPMGEHLEDDDVQAVIDAVRAWCGRSH